MKEASESQQFIMQADAIIVGGGASGLCAALQLADQGLQVLVLSKDDLVEGATRYAQGGIAAVTHGLDSIEAHVEDTLQSGAGLCHREVVEFTASYAREAVQWLMQKGVDFTKLEDAGTDFHLTQEGGHSHRRVLHVKDATGQAISGCLEGDARRHPNIRCLEQYTAVDLMLDQQRCVGLYALENQTGHVHTLAAPHVVLATGGASKAYQYTSNPETSSGDGCAIGYRAGAAVMNMEFNQFHPTCLYHPQAKSFLISEAVRGEGGRLLLPDGHRFMPGYHAQAELAPRDIVARAIDTEMKCGGYDYVLLDIAYRGEGFVRSHFPSIYERCLQWGIDISQQPIPVVPAAHYTCGGLQVDAQGCTKIQGLYAVGETACTGLHGANRMASNSILECLVFAQACADSILKAEPLPLPEHYPVWQDARFDSSLPQQQAWIQELWPQLRHLMWEHAGIVRSLAGLKQAEQAIQGFQERMNQEVWPLSRDMLELRNLLEVAGLMVRSAASRHESRGLHYLEDFPEPNPNWQHDTVIEAS